MKVHQLKINNLQVGFLKGILSNVKSTEGKHRNDFIVDPILDQLDIIMTETYNEEFKN